MTEPKPMDERWKRRAEEYGERMKVLRGQFVGTSDRLAMAYLAGVQAALAEQEQLRAENQAMREGLEMYSRNDFIDWLIETQEGRMSDPCKVAREALGGTRAREILEQMRKTSKQ